LGAAASAAALAFFSSGLRVGRFARERRRTVPSPEGSGEDFAGAGKRAGSGAWKIRDLVDTAWGASEDFFALAFGAADEAFLSAGVDFFTGDFFAVSVDFAAVFLLAVAVFEGVDSSFFVTIPGALLTQFLASLAGTPSRFGKRNHKVLLKKLVVVGLSPVFESLIREILSSYSTAWDCSCSSIAHTVFAS
jgi:hypothetical protein